TLVALGVGGDVDAAAREFTRRHMRGLETAVYCPPLRRAMLERVASRYRTGLISNFDHAPTALAILHRWGLADLLEVVLISDAVGTRKPSRRIFRLASQKLGLRAQDCLYIGDSLVTDVEGAVASGMRALWISADATPGHSALGVLADAAELVAWLNDHYEAGLTAPSGARQ
ncbi:MAG: HAD family hydrolase, partial [Candidatus Binatia bacterium]